MASKQAQGKDENKEMTVEEKIDIIIEELENVNAKLELLGVHTHDGDGRVVVPY